MHFLAPRRSFPRARTARLGQLLSCALLLVLGATRGASAQVAPLATEGAVEPPLVSLEPGVGSPASPSGTAASADQVALGTLTKELLALERQALELEAKRAAIRTTGYHVGKIVSWSASAVFLLTAFSWYGQAQSIHDAVKDGRDDKAYDVSGNHKVTKHDEDVARTVARTMAVTSLIPIGLGVFTTLFELRREREKRDLTNAVEDLAVRRRTLLRRLDARVSASQVHAALQLQLRF